MDLVCGFTGARPLVEHCDALACADVLQLSVDGRLVWTDGGDVRQSAIVLLFQLFERLIR